MVGTRPSIMLPSSHRRSRHDGRPTLPQSSNLKSRWQDSGQASLRFARTQNWRESEPIFARNTRFGLCARGRHAVRSWGSLSQLRTIVLRVLNKNVRMGVRRTRLRWSEYGPRRGFIKGSHLPCLRLWQRPQHLIPGQHATIVFWRET